MRYFLIQYTADFGTWQQKSGAYPWAGSATPPASAVASFVTKYLDPVAPGFPSPVVAMTGFSVFDGLADYNAYVEWYNAQPKLMVSHVAEKLVDNPLGNS